MAMCWILGIFARTDKKDHFAPNRIEVYHYLRRAVSHANFSKLVFQNRAKAIIAEGM
jgi:aminoglycoside/choline kinase family phosphotransferase